MQNMGYCANFADNLEAAKIITKCYENLSQKGYKLPKEVLLMIPEEECIQGFRPYAKKGLELETPIIFNKDFWHSQNRYFLPGIKHNSTDSPEGIIYHEIGHFLHEKTSLDSGVAIKIWKEIDALRGVDSAFMPEYKISRYQKATIKQDTANNLLRPQNALTEFSNVFIAGDWTMKNYPCCMEIAVKSAQRAVKTALKSK